MVNGFVFLHNIESNIAITMGVPILTAIISYGGYCYICGLVCILYFSSPVLIYI